MTNILHAIKQQFVQSTTNPNFQVNYDEQKIIGKSLLTQVRDIAITNLINLVYWVGGLLLFIYLVNLIFSKESDKTGAFTKRAIPVISLMAIAFVLSLPVFNNLLNYGFREVSTLLKNINI
jgi:hypothetical protein